MNLNARTIIPLPCEVANTLLNAVALYYKLGAMQRLVVNQNGVLAAQKKGQQVGATHQGDVGEDQYSLCAPLARYLGTHSIKYGTAAANGHAARRFQAERKGG